MKRRPSISKTSRRINIGNLVQKLRRIRTELGLMMQQVDEALARIEAEAT